jgi:hemolysin III
MSEYKVDIAVQSTGLAASLVGIGYQLWQAAGHCSPTAVAAVAVYGTTLIAMFVCSIQNARATATPNKHRWLMLDHAAIFMLIAGTYTPFCILVIGGREGWILLAGVWVAALLGAISRVLLRRRMQTAIISLYVGLGWCGAVQFDAIFQRLPALGLALLGVGGIIYTLASPLHRYSRLRYHSALWHGCVVAASFCHWGAILVALNVLGAGG